MTTRPKITHPYGTDALSSGYEGKDIPSDFTLPSCGLEDVDRAVKAMFKTEIGFVVVSNYSKTNGVDDPNTAPVQQQVNVKFAAGERFAVVKNQVRDKKGTLQLPLVSIRRTSVDQTTEDVTGRGINQNSGDLVIKRKLAPEDRTYQALINKQGLINNSVDNDGTTRKTGESSNSLNVRKGALLGGSDNTNNVYEVITIPQPQFYTANYEIAFWTQFSDHMNQMIQKLADSYLPQGNKTLRFDTPKGYWFIGTIDDSFSSADNFEDFSEQERIVKYTFSLKVKAYFIAGDRPGAPSSIRRYISAPTIVFELEDVAGNVIAKSQDPSLKDKNSDRFLLSDTERDKDQVQVEPTDQQFLVEKSVPDASGREKTQYVKILSKNQKQGETVFYVTSGTPFGRILK